MNEAFIFLIIVFFGLLFDRMNIFLFCIVSSLIHELGHICAYILLMKKLPKVKASIFGFAMENNVTDNKKLLIILVFGPLINLSAAFVSYIHLENSFKLNIYVFMIVNLVIFIINMLPIYYLDGGTILSLIWPNFYRYSEKISAFSLMIISVMVLCFTSNKLNSLLIILVFLIYYIINTAKAI